MRKAVSLLSPAQSFRKIPGIPVGLQTSFQEHSWGSDFKKASILLPCAESQHSVASIKSHPASNLKSEQHSKTAKSGPRAATLFPLRPNTAAVLPQGQPSRASWRGGSKLSHFWRDKFSPRGTQRDSIQKIHKGSGSGGAAGPGGAHGGDGMVSLSFRHGRPQGFLQRPLALPAQAEALDGSQSASPSCPNPAGAAATTTSLC